MEESLSRQADSELGGVRVLVACRSLSATVAVRMLCVEGIHTQKSRFAAVGYQFHACVSVFNRPLGIM
jgi:hypothetical protein